MPPEQQGNQNGPSHVSACELAREFGLRQCRLPHCSAPFVEATGPALRIHRDPAEADGRIRERAGEGAGTVDLAAAVAECDARFAPWDRAARLDDVPDEASAVGGFARRVEPASHPELAGREREVEALIRAMGRWARPWAWVSGPCGSGRRSLLPRLADAIHGTSDAEYLPIDLAGADAWALEADSPLLDPASVSAWVTEKARDGSVVAAFFRADDTRPVRAFLSVVPAHVLECCRLILVTSGAARRQGDGDETWREPFGHVSLAIPPGRTEIESMLSAQAPLLASRQGVRVGPAVISACADLAAQSRAHIGTAVDLLYGASVVTTLAGRHMVSACDLLAVAAEGGEHLMAAAHFLQRRLFGTAFGDVSVAHPHGTDRKEGAR